MAKILGSIIIGMALSSIDNPFWGTVGPIIVILGACALLRWSYKRYPK